MYYLYDVINFSDFLISNDDLKVYEAIKTHSACSLLQREIVFLIGVQLIL
jgi:hypothetical protein